MSWQIVIKPGSVGVARVRDGQKHRAAVGRGDADNAAHFAKRAIDLCGPVLGKDGSAELESVFRLAFNAGDGPTGAEIRAESERQQAEGQRNERRNNESFDRAVKEALERLGVSVV